ncbi:hypothetical protein YTPLAS18_37340 [Nitrospira sp.]|nr:hypothetical protein YTPLAS18_37340 [Nitrospira sp.]
MIALLTWVHLLASMSWIGGMMFLSLVVVPVLKQPAVASHRGLLFAPLARRFRMIAWISMAILLSTGPLLAVFRGINLSDPLAWPVVLQLKLGLVLILMVLSVGHDLIVGPRVSQIARKPLPERTMAEVRLVRWSPLLARSTLLLAVAVAYAAVSLARS